MFVYDFDRPHEWVCRFENFVAPIADQISREVATQKTWGLSGLDVRAFEPEPAAPAKDTALEIISEDLRKSAIRAFHATRVLSREAIHHEGLLALNRRDHIRRIKESFSQNGYEQDCYYRLDAWLKWSERTEERDTSGREGDCWLTPSRTLLHDGGLDCMFERVGGEFLERISGDPFSNEDEGRTEPGLPTVVVAVVPTEWCEFTRASSPERVLYETMASLGKPLHSSFSSFWDIRISRSIPPHCIELVCDRYDHRVAISSSAG